MSFSECGDGERPTVTVDDNGKYNIKVSNISDYTPPAGESITRIDGGVKLENESVLIPELSRTIAQLMKRVAALEGMIRNETYTYVDGGEKEECVVWGRKIGSGSGDVYNEKFTGNEATFIPEVRNSVEAVVDKDNKEIEKFGAAIMEIGNVIDFHVPNTGCNNGCINCGHGGHEGDIPIKDHQKCPCYGNSAKTDYCARIYVDRNNSLIIRANGLYYQPIHNAATSSLPVTVSENGTCVKAEMAAKKNNGTSYYVRVNNS